VIDAIKQQLRGLPVGFRLSAPVVVSTAAIGLSAYVVATNVGSLLGAAFTSSVDEESADPLKTLATDSEQFLETSRKRFDGRSVYALPSPPPPPRPPVVAQTKPVEPPKPPGPPPAPAAYTGPAPTSVFGDTVNFGQMRVKLGETVEGIKVTEISAPYSIKVEHMRGSYTVPLFARGDDRLLQPTKLTGGASGIKSSSGGGSPEDGGANPAAGAGPMTGPTTGPTTGPSPVGTPSPVGAPSPVGGPGGVAGPSPVVGPGGATPSGAPIPANAQPRNGGGTGAGSPVPGAGSGPGQSPTPAPGGEPTPTGDLPSPAMDPQEVPPPSEPAGQGAGVEYVNREHLPPPRSQEQIAAMTLDQARIALSAIDATANWQVDGHSRARLNHERTMLVQRINQNP
jgi:hypothetical protein